MSLLSQVHDQMEAMENDSGLTELIDSVVNDDLSEPETDIGDVYGRGGPEQDEALAGLIDDDGDELDDDDLDPDLGEDTDADIDDILAEDEDEDGEAVAASSHGFGRVAGPGDPQSVTHPYEESEDNEPYFKRDVDIGLEDDEDDEDDDIDV